MKHEARVCHNESNKPVVIIMSNNKKKIGGDTVMGKRDSNKLMLLFTHGYLHTFLQNLHTFSTNNQKSNYKHII